MCKYTHVNIASRKYISHRFPRTPSPCDILAAPMSVLFLEENEFQARYIGNTLEMSFHEYGAVHFLPILALINCT